MSVQFFRKIRKSSCCFQETTHRPRPLSPFFFSGAHSSSVRSHPCHRPLMTLIFFFLSLLFFFSAVGYCLVFSPRVLSLFSGHLFTLVPNCPTGPFPPYWFLNLFPGVVFLHGSFFFSLRGSHPGPLAAAPVPCVDSNSFF